MSDKENSITEININTDNDYSSKDIQDVVDLLNTYANEFINNNPNLNVKNVKAFTLLCKYIGKKRAANKDSIEELNAYWDCFTIMCYTCNINPTLARYCMMASIDPTTLDTWNKGEYRGGVTSPHSLSVKRWRKECESALVDDVQSSNNVGGMFILKCNYGYRENIAFTVDNGAQAGGIQLTPEQIAEQYGQKMIEDSKKDIPNMDF